MGCSCCQHELPQPNEPPSEATTHDGVASQFSSQLNGVVNGNQGTPDISSLEMPAENRCDEGEAQPETTWQVDDCCRGSANGEIKSNNDHHAPSIKAPADASCDNDSPGFRPEACGGSCCNDQPAEPLCNTDTSPRDDLAKSCCDGSLAIEAGGAKDNTSLKACRTSGYFSTLQPSAPAPAELKASECCRGKPAPCCDESCLDRLALRECVTAPDAPPVEATHHSMLTGTHGLSVGLC